MTRLEDALRDAFDAGVDTPAHDVVSDVRRGARRRRTRRATVAVAAAVTAGIAGVAVGASLLAGGQNSTEPAPSHPTGSTGPVRTDLPGPALSVEAAGGEVFATAHERGCRCTVLWRHDATGWHRVHELPGRYFERLTIAPDGRNGWAAQPGGPLWATHDGGETWTRLPLGGSYDLVSFLVVATDTDVWVANTAGGPLWRAPVDSDVFRQVEAGGQAPVHDLQVVDDAVVLIRAPQGEGNTTSVPLVSRDDGATWTELPFPCEGENRLIAASHAAFTVCRANSRTATVHRSSDLTTWTQWGTARGTYTPALALDDRRVLLHGETDVVVSDDGAVRVDTTLGRGQAAWDAAEADGISYLATDAGVLVTDDGGYTWRPAD